MKNLIALTLLTLALGACASKKTKEAPLKTTSDVVARYGDKTPYEDPFSTEEKKAQTVDGLTKENQRLKEELVLQKHENDRLRQHIGLLSSSSGKKLTGHSNGKPVFQKNVDTSTDEELIEVRYQEKVDKESRELRQEERLDKRLDKILESKKAERSVPLNSNPAYPAVDLDYQSPFEIINP